MTDRQTQAVAEVIDRIEKSICPTAFMAKGGEFTQYMEGRISQEDFAVLKKAASDAKYVKGLVNALKQCQHVIDACPGDAEWRVESIIGNALAALPEDIRNG